MKNSASISCIALALCTPLFGEVKLEGTPQELSNYLSTVPETVSITGRAEKKIPADRAKVSIIVTTESKSMADALKANATLRDQITKQLLAKGFASDYIKAAQFSSTPESGFFSDKVRSYSVKNSMTITTTSELEFSAVAALIDSHKELRYEKTEFELSNRKEVERQLIADACQDALAKKAIYETQLSVQLTPVRFHEGQVMLSKHRENDKVMRMSSLTKSAYAAPTQFDELSFEASLTAEYQLKAN